MCNAIAVAIGVEGVATAIKGTAAAQHGRATKEADYRSADVAERAAADAIERGDLRETQVAMHGSSVVAAQRVIQSGTGADVNIGAPKAVQAGTEAVTDVDRALVRRNAAMEAYGLKGRAQALRQRGVHAEAAGKAAMIGTFLGGMGSMVGKAGKWGADQTSADGDTSYGGGDEPDEAD